ncbi:transposase [Synechocystis sp. LEGE 06083]|uniref:transposase n=1 Tax=Synechocystis sp. LEGE 06083 TaxID=915336 RepID=UPI00187FD787|nr:transposase [Synechocystis sp. LEGE 06083]
MGGITWPSLSHDFPKWKTVYHYFRQWCDDGTLECINQTLHQWERSTGHERSPLTQLWGGGFSIGGYSNNDSSRCGICPFFSVRVSFVISGINSHSTQALSLIPIIQLLFTHPLNLQFFFLLFFLLKLSFIGG